EQQDEAEDAIESDFEQAAPLLPKPESSSAEEICVLAAPPGPSGTRFRELARRALPHIELVASPSSQDIVYYRELVHVPLSSVEPLGPLGYEAYRQLNAVEHFSPHSRMDITEWRAATG